MGDSLAYIEGVVSTYQRAAEIQATSPSRKGTTVVLTAELGRDVLITGDLHGHRQNFDLLFQAAALDRNPQRHLVLQEVCHGGPTYPDSGGCMSHTVLEDVAELVTQFPGRVHFLLGNHELSELTDYPIQKNKQMLNVMFRFGLQHAYGAASDRVRQASLDFLRSCPLAVRVSGGVFVTHSVPDDLVVRGFDASIFTRQPEPREYYQRSSIFDLVWGRDYREENAAAFAELVQAKVLVNGHEPCSRGFSTPNRFQIVLDCCGPEACYVILPIGEELTQSQIVSRIQRL